MKKTLADYWAPRINAQWQKSVEGIIGVGRQLLAAKEACEHGEFARLFKGYASAVKEPVPFSLNTAERLMRIARHPVLANSAHVHTLPQSWGTLYELLHLDDDTLAAGIKAGEITPEMTRSQAAALRTDPVEKPKRLPHEEMTEAIKNAITKFAGQLTGQEQYAYVRRRVDELMKFLSELESQNETNDGSATGKISAESVAVTLHDAISRAMREGKTLDERCGEMLHEHWLRLSATLYSEPLSTQRIEWASDAGTISEVRNAAGFAAGIQGKPEKAFRAVRLSARRVLKALPSDDVRRVCDGPGRRERIAAS